MRESSSLPNDIPAKILLLLVFMVVCLGLCTSGCGEGALEKTTADMLMVLQKTRRLGMPMADMPMAQMSERRLVTPMASLSDADFCSLIVCVDIGDPPRTGWRSCFDLCTVTSTLEPQDKGKVILQALTDSVAPEQIIRPDHQSRTSSLFRVWQRYTDGRRTCALHWGNILQPSA